jgi:hypothetical protein
VLGAVGFVEGYDLALGGSLLAPQTRIAEHLKVVLSVIDRQGH